MLNINGWSLTGALKPWSTPSDETIIEVWNLVFGDDHPIDDGDTKCRRFVVAKTLVGATFFSSSFLVGSVPWLVGTRSPLFDPEQPIQAAFLDLWKLPVTVI